MAKYGAIKDLGAVKHIVYAQPGSTTSLRLQHEKSYEHVSSLLDYATITVETIEEEYALNIPESFDIASEDQSYNDWLDKLKLISDIGEDENFAQVLNSTKISL